MAPKANFSGGTASVTDEGDHTARFTIRSPVRMQADRIAGGAAPGSGDRSPWHATLECLCRQLVTNVQWTRPI
jgi:hypothetical protein